ncbi:hypothetical protein IE995_18295 [Klebsiella pneumoniae]|nr:hypothetical protein [Klebsiella pneumoniae]
MSRKGRPAQAQRRPAMNIRRQAPVFARWRLRLYRAYELDRKGEGPQAMQLQAGASAAPPGNEYPARRHGPA